MKTINSTNHEIVNLSNDVYVITSSYHPSFNYKKGTLVRLISGIENNEIPGHHFNSDYYTVCRIDANVAEFIGIPKKDLLRIVNYC